MGLFDTLNARVLAALARKGGAAPLARVAADSEALSLHDRAGQVLRLPWPALAQVVASQRQLLAGQELMLLLRTQAGQVFEVPASCPGWAELCRCLDQLDGSVPSSRWQLQALVHAAGDAVAVFPGRS